MRPNRRCLRVIGAILSIFFLVELVLLAGWLLRQRQEQARSDYLPPIVQITEPQKGINIPTGSYLPVVANILNVPEAPLKRVEVWLDGDLQEKRESSTDGELSLFLNTNLLIPSEGLHVLMVRAVNSLGIIGQSEPLTVIGIPKSNDIQLLVPLQEGKDLASLAAIYKTDEETILALNPALEGKQLEPGTIIIVPKPADNEPLPAQPAQPLPTQTSFQSIDPAILPLDPAGLPGTNLTFFELKPPEAPSDLQAQVIDCDVTLVWNDNSSNEDGYNIWMKGPNSPAHIITSLQSSKGGQTWYNFSVPATGSIMFWVEAFNVIGLQQSNISIVEVNANCPGSLPTHIQAELLDMIVSGNFNKTYCYISLEGAPETRIPEQDGNFIPIQGNQGDITAVSHTYNIPIPGDNSLEVSGECWGWDGSGLVKLGLFSGIFPMQVWNNTRLELDGGVFKIGLAISQSGAVNGSGALAAEKFPDPFIPPPYNVQEEGTRCPGSNCSGVFLTWKWQPTAGFNGKITGFDIYLDGKPYKSITDPQARSTPVVPPAGCGKPVRWQVAAVSGTVRSMLSLPFEYDLPQCQAYAVVNFETLDIPWTGDGISDGPCDELEFYYSLRLFQYNGAHAVKSFGYGGGTSAVNTGTIMYLQPLQCTKDTPPYTFAQLGSGFGVQNPDTLIIPIPEKNIRLLVGTDFWDQDDNDLNDLFGTRNLMHKYPDLQSAVNALGCGQRFRDPSQGYQIDDTGDTAIMYKLTIYPNPCSNTPQDIPLP